MQMNELNAYCVKPWVGMETQIRLSLLLHSWKNEMIFFIWTLIYTWFGDWKYSNSVIAYQ